MLLYYDFSSIPLLLSFPQLRTFFHLSISFFYEWEHSFCLENFHLNVQTLGRSHRFRRSAHFLQYHLRTQGGVNSGPAREPTVRHTVKSSVLSGSLNLYLQVRLQDVTQMKTYAQMEIREKFTIVIQWKIEISTIYFKHLCMYTIVHVCRLSELKLYWLTYVKSL